MANVRASILADVPMEVPWWVEVLSLAKEWGIPPWDLVWDNGKTVWILRHRVYNRVVDMAQRDKEKHS